MDGTSNLKIGRSGNTYTITIDKLVIGYTDLATGKNGTLTTTLKYKGKIESGDPQ